MLLSQCYCRATDVWRMLNTKCLDTRSRRVFPKSKSISAFVFCMWIQENLWACFYSEVFSPVRRQHYDGHVVRLSMFYTIGFVKYKTVWTGKQESFVRKTMWWHRFSKTKLTAHLVPLVFFHLIRMRKTNIFLKAYHGRQPALSLFCAFLLHIWLFLTYLLNWYLLVCVVVRSISRSRRSVL